MISLIFSCAINLFRYLKYIIEVNCSHKVFMIYHLIYLYMTMAYCIVHSTHCLYKFYSSFVYLNSKCWFYSHFTKSCLDPTTLGFANFFNNLLSFNGCKTSKGFEINITIYKPTNNSHNSSQPKMVCIPKMCTFSVL